MAKDVVISLEQVNKIFYNKKIEHHVLKNINFEIKQGEVVALIGPSGSGKSTCLRTINALETITSGNIEVCGINYRHSKLMLHQIRRNTGMIFQRFELFPHLTALQNVALGPNLVLGKSKKEAENIACQFIEKVGLATHMDKYPRNLSGGQQQRIAIARALAINPKILLCDEPTSALDPELVDEVVDILAGIAATGMTMLIVTHELYFAQKVSHRVIFLENGAIVEEGKTKEVFSHPKTERLTSFINRIAHKSPIN